MKDTWCPTCSKPVRISLDRFPALCGDCRRVVGDERDEHHDETCIVTQLRRALRVR